VKEEVNGAVILPPLVYPDYGRKKFYNIGPRRSIMNGSILILDAMASLRYLLIFKLKNPAAFNDDFWAFFINIWITGANPIKHFTAVIYEFS
jgi:hypothetical protein